MKNGIFIRLAFVIILALIIGCSGKDSVDMSEFTCTSWHKESKLNYSKYGSSTYDVIVCDEYKRMK